MQFLALALLFLCHTFAIATPLADGQVRDLSHEHSPRNVPYADLEKRDTSVPNLVPSTTVKLTTHRAGTAKHTTNTNAFAVLLTTALIL